MTQVNGVSNSGNAEWNRQLANQLDEMDGEKDGKISASVWNAYIDGMDSSGNKIKSYITVENAARSFGFYKQTKDAGRVDWENGWQNGLKSAKAKVTPIDPEPPITDDDVECYTILPEIDGNFGNSAQRSEGDCYLLAAINAIRNLDNGQKILSNLVTISTNENGEKIYTVTFPGAKFAANGLKRDSNYDPDKVYITGTYTFTESEMQEILKQAGEKYSLDDGDIILLEAAFEKYRGEVDKTNKANGVKMDSSNWTLAGIQTGRDSDNILAGGYGYDAMFILTGQKSTLYYVNAPNGLSYSAASNGELVVVPRGGVNRYGLCAVSEIDGAVTNTQSDLNKQLDKIMNDSKDGKTDIAVTAGFTMIHDDGKDGGHVFTVKSVDKDTVTLINPWYPDQELTMTREEFISSVNSLSLTQAPSTNKIINAVRIIYDNVKTKLLTPVLPLIKKSKT